MKYDYKAIPIPQLMQDNCEKDSRGLPVPFVVLKDDKGKHHFKVNDSNKSALCLVKNLCSICGQPLSQDNKWLVGGIASAFDEHGSYIDLPIHRECGHYALQVCPYLAIRNYDSKLDMDKLQKQLENVTLYNLTVDPDRLPLFVFTRPKAIKFILNNPDVYVKPITPYQEVEFWCDGEEIKEFTEIVTKLMGTKWQKYLDEIKKLPQYEEVYSQKTKIYQ